MNKIMKLRYVGQSFGDLTDGKVYECLSEEMGMYRIIDDSGEDYLYSPIRPAQLDDPNIGGRWEEVEQ